MKKTTASKSTHSNTNHHHAAQTAKGGCFDEAYARCLPDMMALEEADILVPNIDLALVTTTVFGVLPKLDALRNEIHRLLPRFDLRCIDRLGDCAAALMYAHGLYLGSIQTPSDLVDMQTRAVQARDTLYADANGLVVRGMLRADRLQGFRTRTGYRAVATDIVGLAALLTSDWERFAPCVGTKLHDLVAAQALASDVLSGVGVRAASPAVVAEAAANRQRAFTLLVKTYDQVRRIVIFVRWNEGDADSIAPSLYAGRGNGGNRRKSDPVADPADPAPVADASTGAAAPAPGAHATAPPAEPEVTAPGSGPSSSAAPGMPGSHPFIS